MGALAAAPVAVTIALVPGLRRSAPPPQPTAPAGSAGLTAPGGSAASGGSGELAEGLVDGGAG
jgi:hypothetical protein